MKQLFVLTLVFAAVCASGQTFSLRNNDGSSVFYWWTLPAPESLTKEAVLPRLPLAPGGRHAAAPGERVHAGLGPGQVLVGVFVPWGQNLSFRTSVAGGYLLPAEVPERGTILVNAASFAAANRGRAFDAPLQAWGLAVPQFVLDGRAGDWAKVLPALEWGPGFRPDARPWPRQPRPKSLQAADRDGALWIRLVSDSPWSVPAGTASLLLTRPGASLEWPLTGGIVWSWTGAEAAPVGWAVASGNDLEAWLPWDRLSEADRTAWKSARATWSLAVTAGSAQTWDLGPFSLGELP